jgi:hypothetical protein
MPVSDVDLIDEFIDALWLADGLSKNTLGAPIAATLPCFPAGSAPGQLDSRR